MDEKRLENFEKMLCAVQKEYEDAVAKMEELKAKGRVKSATYHQLMGRKNDVSEYAFHVRAL